MLFPVQMRHDGAHFPGYHAQVLPKWVEALDRRHEITAQLGVKPHGMHSALPEHKEVAIAEADSPAQIAGLVMQLLPGEPAEIKVTPVTPVEEMLAMARQMSGG